MAASTGEQSEKLNPQDYAGYGSKVFPKWLSNRTAEKQAAFLLPHLRPGMYLLDCGCGPGSITLGLANAVAPGSAVGIDIDANQTEIAQKLAVEYGAHNVRFEAASVYQLPFADGSFDAVFSNTLLGHLHDPLAALHEIYRVLKSGGVAGMRVADNDGILMAPQNPLLVRSSELFRQVIGRRGGDVALGKHTSTLMQQAGFIHIAASATYESYGTEEATQIWGAVWSRALHEESNVQQFINAGAEPAELESIRQAWEEWGETPGAFFADSFCEVVGWKK